MLEFSRDYYAEVLGISDCFFFLLGDTYLTYFGYPYCFTFSD